MLRLASAAVYSLLYGLLRVQTFLRRLAPNSIRHNSRRHSADHLLSVNFVHVFRAILKNSEIMVVYHLQGQNGWSTVCANGKQNLPQESVGNSVRD